MTGKDRERTRIEARKQKRLNRMLNTSIVVVGGLILFFASQLFFVGEDQAIEEEDNVLEEESDTPVEEDQTSPEDNPDMENTEENNPTERESLDSEENTEEEGPRIPEAPREDGTWEPVGTEQSGAFHHDFNKGSQNWKEMEIALQYATGLSKEEMIIWQLENGGEKTAIGTVSDRDHQGEPFQVTMQFIENEGWKPIDVKVLDSNPYGG